MMFKKLLSVSILFYLVSVSAHAQENNSMLTMGTMLVSTPIHCAPTIEIKKVFLEEDLVFTGFIDQNNIFKIFVNKDKAWSSMLVNSAGLSCVYFSGVPGILKTDEKEGIKNNKLDSMMKGKIKKNAKWRK